MGVADLIINNKKKKEYTQSNSVADSIINGTYKPQQVQPTIKSVENTVNTLNNIKTKNTITDEEGNVTVKEKPKKKQKTSVLEGIVKGANPEIADKAKYVGKSGISGVISSLGGIVDAPLQNIQEGAEKGKDKSKLENYTKAVLNTFDMYGITKIPEIMKESSQIIQDPNKSAFSKATGIGLKFLNNNQLTRGLEASGQTLNVIDKNAPESIKKIREKNVLNKASDIVNEELQQEGKDYDKVTQTLGEVNQVLGNMLPSMAATAVTKNPDIGLAVMGVGAKGQSTREAEQKGADLSTANEIGLAKGLTEVATEKLTGGLKYFGKGTADDIVNAGINKAIKNKTGNFVAKQAAGIMGEQGEEVISDVVGLAIDKATTDPDANIADYFKNGDFKKTMLLTLLSTGALNTISGGYGKQAYQLNVEELEQIAQNEKVQKVVNERMKELTTPNMTPEEIETLRQQTKAVVLGEIQQNVDDILDSSIAQLQEQPQMPTQTPINALSSNIQEQNNQILYQQQTPQIAPLNQVNQELQETRQQDVADSVKAMNLEQEPQFTQKQGNYVYEKSDNSKIDNLRKDAATYLKEGEQTTNFVNTLEKLVKDKDIEIRFDTKLGNNVNGTYKNGVITINPNSNRAGEFVAIHELTHAIGTKPMIDMIQTYRKSNAEFNNAVERLLSTYNTTEINEEALGDIAGQLFGNQEYINNLSMENPSLFKKIYNEIKYLWHQFRGYKNQDQFIEDLRNKWESAYRNQEVQQKAKNSNIEMSNQTDSNGNMLSNEQVDYFKDSKARDENGNLIPVYHGTNYDFTIFKNPSRKFNEYASGKMFENTSISMFTDSQEVAQTYIDNEENQNKKPMKEYLNITNPYIIDAKYQNNKFFYDENGNPTNVNELVKKIYDSGKYDGVIIKNIADLGNYEDYDVTDGRQYATDYIVFNSNQIKNIDNLTPTKSDDIRYSTEEVKKEPIKDNTGRELSKEQQQFFKDTKVRDNDGNLITVYHTMTDRGPQFNEFNPTGSDYYKFGDQVVNYYTDDKNMSGSYADQRYEMADTKKISSIEEAEKIVNQFNGDSPNETIKIEKNGNGYKLVNNLYKNAYEKAKTIWENEITDEEKKIEKDYEELYKRYVESGYDNNLVPEFTSLENYAKEYSQKLDKLNDSMTPEERNAFLSFRKSDVKVETNPIVIAEYETEDKLFRNLKQDIQKADDESQHKYQYEGYVNITNPYIIDAEGRTWNKVESKADSDFTKELLKVTKEDRQYLERLASDSIKTYNDNLFNYQQAERAINDFASDRTNTTLEQRLMHRTIHDLGFEDFMKILNNEDVYWGRKEQFMDDMFNNGIANLQQKKAFDNTGTIPSEVLERAKNIINEPAKYEDRYIKKELDALGIKPDVKNTTIFDLWNNQQNAYKTYDEGGRYENSKFDKEVNERNLYRQLGNEELFKIAKKGFTDENVRLLYNDWSVTNDIVKSIIELNKAGENYDGVIMKNVVDYGGESKEHTPHDLYITFNSNQFKAVDNLNPTEDPDIRYSKDNQTWREYLEKEFPSQGTRTNLQDINERNKPKQENKTIQEEKPQEMPKNESSNDDVKQLLDRADKILEQLGYKEPAVQETLAYETMQKYVDTGRDTDFKDYFRADNGNIIARAKNGTYSVIDGDVFIVDGEKIPTDGRYKSKNSSLDRDYIDINDNNFTDVKYSTEEVTDSNGKKVKLKQTGNNVYEKEVKPVKNQVIPDTKNETFNVGDKKVSNFYSNITEKSKFITEENRESLKDNENLKYYDAITNKETLENAMDKLNKNPEQQTGDFFAKKEFTPEDVATGWILVKRYQDAGNFDAMSNVIEKMREQGTKAGQTVQMYGILQRLTPEGMEYYSQKQLDNAFNKFSENKSKKQIEKYAKDFTLTAEEHQFIKDTMEKVQNMTDEDAKKVEVAKIVQMLSDKLPPEKGQRLKAWMRISMLGNPKTQVRNIMGNAIIQPVNWVGDVFSSATDKLIAKKTGVRTKGQTDFGALAGGFVKGGKEAVRDAKLGIDTRDINLNRFEENIGAKPFYEGHKSKALNKAAKALNKTNQILGNVMSGGDRVFYQAVYENSLQNQMKLNKIETPTQEMIDIATNEALSRTWNDSNEYTKSVLQIRSALNKLNVKGYGLGDVLIPFAKTPANLTKAIVDYSPVGLTRSILQDGKNLKNSLENGQYNAKLQHKFADSLGKGVAGSMLYIMAYSLAKAGITSGASDDDKDVANFMRNTLGIQPYSVKIGDKSFTYDWAQPIAAPFAITSDYKRITEKENQDLSSALKSAVSSGSNILLEQSFLSSIQDVFNNYNGPTEAMMDQIKGLPARATPTFFKQIADMCDPTKRQTFEKGQSLGENIKNQVIAKLPEASKSLESQRDTLGREIEKYGGDENKLKYAFNVFLNPANTQKGKTSKAAEEIYEVYKATGDKTIMPRQVGYSENIGGTTKNLTAKERNEWQKLSGEKIEENVSALINNSKYNSMSDEDKAAVINGIVNYSYAKAKSDLFGTNISTMYRTAAKKEEQGIALYDYYIDRVSKRR